MRSLSLTTGCVLTTRRGAWCIGTDYGGNIRSLFRLWFAYELPKAMVSLGRIYKTENIPLLSQ
jgi:hypothetical protein